MCVRVFARGFNSLARSLVVVSCPKCQLESCAEHPKSIDDVDCDQWGMGSLVEPMTLSQGSDPD